MNDFDYFMTAFWLGYFFCVFVYSLILLVVESYHKERYWKFMVESKLVQKYEDWNIKNKFLNKIKLNLRRRF